MRVENYLFFAILRLMSVMAGMREFDMFRLCG